MRSPVKNAKKRAHGRGKDQRRAQDKAPGQRSAPQPVVAPSPRTAAPRPRPTAPSPARVRVDDPWQPLHPARVWPD